MLRNGIMLIALLSLQPAGAAPPADDLGACCLHDGSCFQATAQDCDSAGGLFEGAGTMCDASVCLGACCAGEGGCVEIDVALCDFVGGVFQGVGAPCDEDACPSACCLDAECILIPVVPCLALGGLSFGGNLTCDDIPCGFCNGDTNADDRVDVWDLINVILDWESNGRGHGGDVNFDSLVNILDLMIVLTEWGACDTQR